ncbi:MAG TPA: PAS-domain containing protein, partial [Rubellimicrobium sp.]|nr:PAS-domain containing protein [Rubellimicrobium sp.]
MLDPLEIIGAGLFAFVGAALIIGGLTLWTRRAASWRLPSLGEPTVFLFEGQDLVDATPAARRLLLAQGPGDSDLARLLAFLARGFGVDLGRRLAGLPPGGRLSFPSPSGAGLLEVAEEGGALRLTLRPDDRGGSVVDRLSFDAAQEELLLLRGLAEDAPQPIWMLDGAGALTWANRAYLTLADQAGDLPGDPGRAALIRTAWPATPLFERSADLREGHLHQERLPLALPGWKEALWYDVTSIRRGSGSLHFAADVSGLLQAESARLHFVQTLAKTFAHLSTGLAIFDRDRRLVLFNPAFLDLTGLPIGFLSDRPLVQDVLDRLRDAKILPEPRDYASWRESVAALEAAAEQGQYCETWTLPGGQTYQVTGRPHPDGALAFLFEDISVEVGLTRRFRAELDTLRDVLDRLEDAVAVFSADGRLALSNAAYAALWPVPDGSQRATDLSAEAARWEAACGPKPLWAWLREGRHDGLPPPPQRLRLDDGRLLILCLSTLPQGATLARFRADPRAADQA